jgi:hypothetical protein
LIPAKADETLKWRHVMLPTSFQVQQVGDVNGHSIGLVRLPGMAFFPDGSTGTSLVVGTNDVVTGVGGTVNGYYTVNLTDGSELWLKYTGTVKYDGPRLGQKGAAIVIGGKGRYAGAKGEGTYEGAGTTGAESISYVDNVINIKK